MKKSIKLTLILTFLVTNLATFGQQQWGVRANGGLSRITISSDRFDSPFSTPFVASGQAGIYYHLFLGKHSSLGADLLFSQIEGKDIMDRDFNDLDGSIVGHATNIGYRNISYISLPLYYGYTVKKFTFHAGFQLSYALSSRGREKNYGQFNENGQVETVYNSNKVNDINIKKLDFGPRVGIIYQLTNRLGVEGTYYYGLLNIQEGEQPFWDLKVQQVSMGIKYALRSNSKNQ